MPHFRRRKFSMQHGVSRGDIHKVKNGSSTSTDINVKDEIQIKESSSNTADSLTKTDPDSVSSIISLPSSIKETDNYSSAVKLHQNLNKDTENLADQSNETLNNDGKGKSNISTRQKKRASEHQTIIPRQHRVKVRSPKQASTCTDMSSVSDNNSITNHSTVSTDAIDWDQEMETCLVDSAMLHEAELENMERSNHSIDDMCRICHGGDSVTVELGQLISACACRGTVGRVHVKCLERWLTESGKSRCELCGTRYATHRVHRYGVPRALLMWILSQNAKQLMVDSLGIMLMSPLAVLAAWLSGRTLAALMVQDAYATPWPLASTFVLACMTLVCYYCWIVSAATRHALGWWIWYRSQYEVRLQCDQFEE